MAKKLYVLTSDQGDGSRAVWFTFDHEWIKRQQAKDNNGELDYDAIGVDGDGFGYDVLNVPDECTPQSMGFKDCASDEDEDE